VERLITKGERRIVVTERKSLARRKKSCTAGKKGSRYPVKEKRAAFCGGLVGSTAEAARDSGSGLRRKKGIQRELKLIKLGFQPSSTGEPTEDPYMTSSGDLK